MTVMDKGRQENRPLVSFVQISLMGWVNYTVTIAIPSLCSDPDAEDYYSNPWERTADWFGGVGCHTYLPGSLEWGISQFFLGPISVPLYLIWRES